MNNVSVVMAVYNGSRFLREQIDSVLMELLAGDELIVINDASTDGSLGLFEEFSSKILKVYSNEFNLGVIRSFERGLSLATRDIIFLCDQDDIWMKGKRNYFVREFEKNENVTIVISDAQVIDENGQMISKSFMAQRGGFRGSVTSTIWRNCYLGCSMAMRRTLLEMALPIPPFVPMHDMWFGAIGRIFGSVMYIPYPLLKYRRHSGNVSPSHRQSFIRMFRWRFLLIYSIVSRIISFWIRSFSKKI